MVAIDATLGTEHAKPVCVLTRIRLRGIRPLARFLWAYWRLRTTLGGVPGLLHIGLLAEGPLTYHILSVWRGERLMGRWIGDPAHVQAIRECYLGASEVWSGRWRLEAVSPSARHWSAAPAMEGEWIRREVNSAESAGPGGGDGDAARRLLFSGGHYPPNRGARSRWPNTAAVPYLAWLERWRRPPQYGLPR